MVHLESSSQESSSHLSSTDVGMNVPSAPQFSADISEVLQESSALLNIFIEEALKNSDVQSEAPAVASETQDNKDLKSVYTAVGKATREAILQIHPGLAEPTAKMVITRFLSAIRPVIKDMIATLSLF